MLRALSSTTFTALCFSLCSVQTSAQTPIPFNTTVRNYAYVGKTGYNANVARITLHKSLNPGASNGGFDTGQVITFTNGSAQGLNGAGINRVDGFLYGIEYLYAGPFSTNAKFFRVGTNAVATQVGIIPAPTSGDAGRSIGFSFVNLASGMVDSLGSYWFMGYTYTDMSAPYSGGKVDMFLGKIAGLNNLTTSTTNVLTPTYYKLDISDTLIQRGLTNLMTQQVAMIAYFLPPTNADGGWQDMDVDPITKQLYSYIGFPSTPSTIGVNPYPKPVINSYLIYVDKTTSPWKVVPVNTTPNTNPNREEDGAFFDGTGHFYVGFTDGQYSQVNLSTGALVSVNQSALPLYLGNMRGDFATNGTSLNIPLPVKLTAFSAKKTEGGNELFWQTEAESDMSRYEVQRSADGSYFNPIGDVSPQVGSGNYHFVDAASSETLFYRLKMVAKSGQEEYSGTVRIDGDNATNATSVYPTIIAGGVLSIITDAAKVSVQMYSLNGQLMQTFLYSANTSGGSFTMPVALASGTYIARITNLETGRCLNSSTVIIP